MRQINYFDTTTTDDLTDAQIQVMIDNIGSHYKVRDVRAICMMPTPKAIIALARLMRDHPELFEEPVDPDVLAVREAMAKRYEDKDCILTALAAREGQCDNEPEFLAALDLLRSVKPTEPEVCR